MRTATFASILFVLLAGCHSPHSPSSTPKERIRVLDPSGLDAADALIAYYCQFDSYGGFVDARHPGKAVSPDFIKAHEEIDHPQCPASNEWVLLCRLRLPAQDKNENATWRSFATGTPETPPRSYNLSNLGGPVSMIAKVSDVRFLGYDKAGACFLCSLDFRDFSDPKAAHILEGTPLRFPITFLYWIPWDNEDFLASWPHGDNLPPQGSLLGAQGQAPHIFPFKYASVRRPNDQEIPTVSLDAVIDSPTPEQ